jgi:phosphoserine phosphatase
MADQPQTDNIQLLVIDVDGTLTQGNSWQRLSFAMGVTPEEVEHYYHLYHIEQAMSYQSWIDTIVKIYLKRSKPTRQRITEVMHDYELMPGAREAIRILREHYRIAIVSGATDIFVEAVAADLSINTFTHNATTVFNDNDELVQIISRGEDGHVKVGQLNEILEQEGLSLEQCVCIGDSYSDIALFEATGRGITFDHCELLHGRCWKRAPDWDNIARLLL